MKHDRFPFDLKLVFDEYWDLELSNNTNVDIYGKFLNFNNINTSVDDFSCSDFANINVVSSEVELSIIWECELSGFDGELTDTNFIVQDDSDLILQDNEFGILWA
jgi:hypothetical protein